MEDYMQYAKDLAKAERELKIEHWVYISFEIKHEDGSRELLHKIDIPRSLYDRWRWLIEWRRAKLVCKYPRKSIWVYHTYYDKRTGLETGFGTLLGKLSAAKAQVSKAKRIIAQYVEYMSQNDLFFNPKTDDKLQKANSKLERKIQHCALLHAELEQEVKQHQNTGNMYKLFIGFNKLGEFGSISEAKQYAQNSGLSGVFNLMGDDGYRDSWYIPTDNQTAILLEIKNKEHQSNKT